METSERSINTSPEVRRVIADAMRILGHPARLQIIEALAAAGGTMTGVELRNALKTRRRDMLSKHLKELKRVGLVTFDGRATAVALGAHKLMVIGQYLVRVGSAGGHRQKDSAEAG